MAPKRSKPSEDPPAASLEEEEETSSGEEEEEDGEEEEESSSSEETEDEREHTSPPPPLPKPAPKKPNSTTQQTESESESGSDDDSETEDDQPNNDATVIPIASKPMEETPPKTTKPRSKPSASTQASTKSAATSKRGSETDRNLKDSKRAKKDSETDGVAEKSEDTKKQLFQRLWSEDDEIAVLKGIIDFTEKKGYDPSKDMISFYDFIKKSLHFDVSLSQLKDKVWRLKKKFENHVSKGKKGEDKKFSKAHDQTTFDLSKKIWGRGSEATPGVESSAKSNGNLKKGGSINNNQRCKSLAVLKAELGVGVDKETEKVDKMDVEMESHSGLKQINKFDNRVNVVGMGEYVVKSGLDMLEGAKKAEMEEKWRNLHVAQLELFLRRNELIREQAKLMLAAYKN